MSATAATVGKASPSSRSAPTRDPPRLQLLAAALTFALTGLLIRNADSLVAALMTEWRSLVFWAVLVALVSIFPIRVEDTLLTVDEPILLALVLLYPPEVAALVALLASIDIREFKGQVVFGRALYNHAQVGLSVYLAGAAFRLLTGGDLDHWPIAVLGTAAAVSAEYVANVALVSLHARVRWRVGFREAARKLRVGSRGQFLSTHLGYGCLALVLVHLFLEIGSWSVVTFIVPILVARQMLIRGQAIEALTEEVRIRDQLLEGVSDRILDERRDERRRVAGDLHDGILQELTKIWLLGKLIDKGQPSDTSQDIERLMTISEASIETLRATIHDLRNSTLGRADLIRTIDGLVRDARLEWKARINLQLPDRLRIAFDSHVVVYQVARECLLNALKHAQATAINVKLLEGPAGLVLEVQDNGIGFHPDSINLMGHFGLALMKERVHQLGGDLEIETSINKGTVVRASFPLTNPSKR